METYLTDYPQAYLKFEAMGIIRREDGISCFFQDFPDETTCRKHFKAWRDKVGVVCKKCYHKKHYWLEGKQQYQCKNCGFRTTLRSGTVMQWSKLSFHYWYIAIRLITCSKKSFSSKELQRLIGHKRYEPIWALAMKIRRRMSDDIGFGYRDFETSATISLRKRKGSAPDDPRFSQIKIFRAGEGDSKLLFMRPFPQSEVPTLMGFQKHDFNRIIFHNLTSVLSGLHHLVSGKYIQHYLDEFCFKFNRRKLGVRKFDQYLYRATEMGFLLDSG